ncbi:MAG: hypothetical protein JXB08_00445 [Bacilli bacterium]|nr:hypothetical protein [Bacilli bacterium]MBN2877972.1 hypothetical protein [Bacilli bacterium]
MSIAESTIYALQNRWIIDGSHLVYYGMRVDPNLLNNKIRITSKQKQLIFHLPSKLDEGKMRSLSRLLKQKIIVSKDKVRKTPKSLDEATYCKECVANDFMIPGLEFNQDGLCPMCENKAKAEEMRSIIPIKNTIERNEKGRFDVAVFYTGGKDSSYLLYYLARIQNLRVLAFTWDMPFMTKNARQSIENAKKQLDNVEFVSRKMSDRDLHKIYEHLYQLEQNPCACPSLAYALFYPDMVDEKIPYFVLGNEPVQMQGIYYNGLTPGFAYNQKYQKYFNILLGIGRILTLRRPFRLGQFHALMTMRQLAYGDSLLKRMAGYESELITHVSDAMRTNSNLVKPLKRAIRRSNWSGNIPALVHVDFDQTMEGRYNWTKIKRLLQEEMGWVGPAATDKSLHTSCLIETCKENSQFQRFYKMESRNIPFSAIEISLASMGTNYSREEALQELKNHLGFSLDMAPSCKLVKQYLKEKKISG